MKILSTWIENFVKPNGYILNVSLWILVLVLNLKRLLEGPVKELIFDFAFQSG